MLNWIFSHLWKPAVVVLSAGALLASSCSSNDGRVLESEFAPTTTTNTQLAETTYPTYPTAGDDDGTYVEPFDDAAISVCSEVAATLISEHRDDLIAHQIEAWHVASPDFSDDMWWSVWEACDSDLLRASTPAGFAYSQTCGSVVIAPSVENNERLVRVYESQTQGLQPDPTILDGINEYNSIKHDLSHAFSGDPAGWVCSPEELAVFAVHVEFAHVLEMGEMIERAQNEL